MENCVADFLPVGSHGSEEVCERGYLSLSDDDDEGVGMEYACSGHLHFDSFVLGDDGDVSADFA